MPEFEVEDSAQILLGNDYGWRLTKNEQGASVAFKGHFASRALGGETNFLLELLSLSRAEVARRLASLDGNFAFVVSDGVRTIAAVDRIRSIPLLFARNRSGRWLVSDHAAPVRAGLELGVNDVDAVSANEIALSGYVLSDRTLYRKVSALLPGQFAVFEGRDVPSTERYALYRPWLIKRGVSAEAWRANLLDGTAHVLEKLVARAAGRRILLPLSAGLDSRLIASGLKHLGCRDVVCFSYGRPGNHEAEAARRIAGKLGYPWHMLPTTTAEFRAARSSADYQRYLALADNLVATPVEQDVYPVMQLRHMDWAPQDSIIVNGQSGDFISGNHIPARLTGCLDGMSRELREALIFDCMVAKHFDLWDDLKTPTTLAAIKQAVWSEFRAADAPLDDPDLSFALYEFFEFQNRQCKYVLGNQRGYEVFGWDWHLPLWDVEYLDFWQSVPMSLKFGQKLYRDSLVEANWGGVWTSLLPAPRWVTPAWLRPIRGAVRIACAPFGANSWHKFEKRVFAHVMDPLRKYAAVSWFTVALTNRSHRNVVSWLTAQYLGRHSLDWAGRPL